MFKDFKELLSALNDNRVKYLVVGGYAVSYHAQPRATNDLDLLVKPESANAVALYKTLATFGAPLSGLSPNDLIDRGSFFRMGTPPVMVDILPEISGVDFDRAWRNRVPVMVDPSTRLQATFISANDLIRAKIAAGRPKDLVDVDALRQAAASRRRAAKHSSSSRDRQTTRKPR